jgi:putative addiction module component (TIGR02574 family)
MATFADVFDAAQSLPVADRVRLMEAIWDRLSPDEWPPPSQEWMAEAQRRSNACDAGAMSVASWSDVRSRTRKNAGLDG